MLLPLLPIILLLPLSTREVEGDNVAALAVAASAASCCHRRRQRRHRRRRRLTLTLPIILLLPLSTLNVEGDDVAALAVAASAASCCRRHRQRCHRRCRCRVDAVVMDVGWQWHQIRVSMFPAALACRTSSLSWMPAPPPFLIPCTTPHSFSSIFKRYLFGGKPRENQHHMRWVTATGGGSGGRGVHSMMSHVRSPPPTRLRELSRPRARHQIIGSVELDTDATHDIWSQTLSLPTVCAA